MKRALTLIFVAALSGAAWAQSTLQRMTPTTSAFTRSFLTNETAAGARNGLGIDTNGLIGITMNDATNAAKGVVAALPPSGISSQDATNAAKGVVATIGSAVWVTPAAYGAAGNGVTDDTAALTAAANAASAVGAPLYLPPATYAVKNWILPYNITVYGSGATLKGIGDHDAALTVTNPPFVVQDLQVNGPPGFSQSYDYTVAGANYYYIYPGQYHGVNLNTSAAGSAIRNVTSSGFTGAAWFLNSFDNSGVAPGTPKTQMNALRAGNSHIGVWFAGWAEYGTIEGMTIYGCDQGVLDAAANIRFVNNQINGCTIVWMQFGGAGNQAHCFVSNNMLNHNLRTLWCQGIIPGNYGFRFANNLCLMSAASAYDINIMLDGCTGVIIENNTFATTSGGKLSITNTSGINLFRNNIIFADAASYNVSVTDTNHGLHSWGNAYFQTTSTNFETDGTITTNLVPVP